MAAKFQGGYSDAEVADLRLLDDVNLADSGKNMPSYKARWAVYQQSIKASPPLTYASSLDLLTQGWNTLTDILTHIAEIRTLVQQYDGKLREKVIAICNYSLHRAETIHSDEFCKAFLTQAHERLSKLAMFPLVGPPTSGSPRLKPEDAVSAGVLLGRIGEGLRSPALQSVQSPSKQALVDFSKKIAPLHPIVDALLTPEKSLRMCRIVLLGRQQQFELSGQRTDITTYRAVQLRAGTIEHGAVVKYGTPGLVPTDAGSEIELGRFTLYEPFHFHFHRAVTDTHIAVDMPAPSTWTALELLDERQGTRIADGTRWRVSLAPESGKLIWVEMRFDKPFPDFDAWPTRRTGGAQSAMSEFTKNFLRERIDDAEGSAEYFGIFGKHPGWDDHIEDLPLPTVSMVTAKQLLYVQGIGSQISSGAWSRLSAGACLPDFNHILLWVRERQFLVGRLWASRDGKRRAHFPMIALVHGINLPLEAAFGPLLAQLEQVVAGCRATTSADTVRKVIARVSSEPPVLPDKPPDPGPTLRIARSSVLGLTRDLRGNLPPRCRLPADPLDCLRSLRFWSRVCASLASPDIPLVFLAGTRRPVDPMCSPASPLRRISFVFARAWPPCPSLIRRTLRKPSMNWTPMN